MGCSFASSLWRTLFRKLGIIVADSQSVKDCLIKGRFGWLDEKHLAVWKATTISIFWEIRAERNERVFAEREQLWWKRQGTE
ncbi:hypothetical protein Syun_009492 [Stephania yunnanensis]|uniref:Uncharacterized protein n=1 Tax=Stephania yunnanensis TaxID=152371 RepID=A0AAP0KEL8_9MAGN